ncbi:F-box/LRR-repeat protein 14 [Biomphalaria glabrata]|nr:F-box/LRR-repeat protein 14 [Biomphalaria glabrata]
MLINICKYLKLKDKTSLAATCSQLKDTVYIKRLWKNTTVFIDLPAHTDDFKHIYTSFETRGINSLHFTVNDYSHFDAHIALMATHWPGLFTITDETQLDPDGFPGETGVLQGKTLLNVRFLKLCSVNTNFVEMLQDLFPHLLELDISLTSFCDECAEVLVRSQSQINILRASNTLITNRGVGYICGSFLSGQRDNDVPAQPLSSLKLLDISSCSLVTPNCFALLERLENLNTFYIGNRDLNSATDLGYLARCGGLKCLIVENNSMPEKVLSLISESGFRLHCLSLNSNINDQSLIAFRNGFSNLLYLKLKSERITDKGMATLAEHLNQLIGLDLTFCISISYNSVLTIQNKLKNLKFLRILGCHNITSSQVASISSHICVHSDFGYSKEDIGLDVLKSDEEDSIWFRRVFFD